MVTLTKIDPKDIPEVSNKFLMRGTKKEATETDADNEDDQKRDRKDRRRDRSRENKDARNKYFF